MDGYVRQIDSIGGVVVECSAVNECIKANPEALANPVFKQYMGNCSCRIKNCQLTGNPEHGNRCVAWPCDTTTWLIDSDPNKIKNIPR